MSSWRYGGLYWHEWSRRMAGGARRVAGGGEHPPVGQLRQQPVDRRLPGLYATNPETGRLEPQSMSTPEEWSRPPAFPSGAAGLASTVDDCFAYAQMLLNCGVHQGRRLLSAESVRLLTTNHLTGQQIADAGTFPLSGHGWGYGMAVSVTPDEVSGPGRYGWDGGSGTTWFNDPGRGLTAIALTQTVDFLFNGAREEFQRLAAATVNR